KPSGKPKVIGVAGRQERGYTALFVGNNVFTKDLTGIGFRVMRFNLVDRILEVEPGVRISVVKNLTMGEEYLADHFPTFPVMPGVLMLQTLVEAGSWLLRITEDFQHSVIVLREAKNVKYGNFLEPGKSLTVSVEVSELGPVDAVMKGKGESEGILTVS